MSLLFLELLSLDKVNSFLKDNGLTITLGTIITVVIASAIFLMKNLVLDSFDIKLLHKNSHTAIKLTKSLTSITLMALYFFGVDWYLFFVLNQFPKIDIILLFVFIIYFLLYLLNLIIYGFHKLIYKIKALLGNNQSSQTDGIYNSYIKNFKNIFILSTTFLLMLISTFLLIVLDDSGKEHEYLIGVSFLYSLIPSVAIFFYKPNNTKSYVLSKILTDPLEIADLKLNLEYSIDKTSSVLTNNEGNIKAIKHIHDGNYSVEIYDVVEIHRSTSDHTVTPVSEE